MNRTLLLTGALGLLLASLLSAATLPNFIVVLSDDQSWAGISTLMDTDDAETKSDFFLRPQVDRLARHIRQKDQAAWPEPGAQKTDPGKIQ